MWLITDITDTTESGRAGPWNIIQGNPEHLGADNVVDDLYRERLGIAQLEHVAVREGQRAKGPRASAVTEGGYGWMDAGGLRPYKPGWLMLEAGIKKMWRYHCITAFRQAHRYGRLRCSSAGFPEELSVLQQTAFSTIPCNGLSYGLRHHGVLLPGFGASPFEARLNDGVYLRVHAANSGDACLSHLSGGNLLCRISSLVSVAKLALWAVSGDFGLVLPAERC
jgi:hypothetical protein